MLLTITTTRAPATDLGYLLHKHPERLQSFTLPFGQAHVFYPEATAERCTAALLLDVDPVGLIRRGVRFPRLDQYVNDRPYVASSFLSVAIARVLNTALAGKCSARPELPDEVLPLRARIAVLPCAGGEEVLRRLFEPLGYVVHAVEHPLDERFPEWGESRYFTVELEGEVRLRELLAHLYVLVPVLDAEKHYWVGEDEVEKLLRRGEGWLGAHPDRELIVSRYLKHQRSLRDEALAKLLADEEPDADSEQQTREAEEEAVERPLRLHEQRLGTVVAVLKASGAKRVLDLGCGGGKLIGALLKEPSFEQITGVDISHRALEIAESRLRLERLAPRQRQRVQLFQTALTYRDGRLAGFDAAAAVEVIEHLDEPRLASFERVVFEHARPSTVVVTTPNREYNARFEALPAGRFRHRDHRFEWTRSELEGWAGAVAGRQGYGVRFLPVGPEDAELGAPTQMAVFERMKPLDVPELSLVVLVGASGSGKSTFASTHFRPTEVLSSDFCRGLVSDDENDQGATKDAFELLHFIAAKRLAAGRLTVVDATSVKREDRAQLVRLGREHHVLPVAIVFDLPEGLCQERNRNRADRDFGPHVIRNQTRELRRGLRGLRKEGFRQVHVLASPEEVEAATIERTRLWNNRSDAHGPFDIVGDVHGCCDELELLLAELGYEVVERRAGEFPDGGSVYAHPDGRTAVFVGDLVDRGPRILDSVRLVRNMVEHGSGQCVPGNHDQKLVRKLRGRDVQITHGLDRSLAELDALPDDRRAAGIEVTWRFLDSLVSHYVYDDRKLVVAHAGMKEEMQGRGSGKVRDFALYGETTGETDEFGLPVRWNWAAEYRGSAMVVYGHTPVPDAEWLNRTINIDTGCVFGGRLTALRYPELELVGVPAAATYANPVKPFLPEDEQPEALTTQQREDELLDIEDVLGKRIVSTRLARNVTIPEENAIAALEVMGRFAVNPKWLVYLPPTVSPSATSTEPGLLEHPAEAFSYFRQEGIPRVVCEEKHMGSRAVVIVCRDEETARRRFGVVDEGLGSCFTRTGRRFFDDDALESAFLVRVRDAVAGVGLFERLESDWVLLDCELMPWSAKAQELLRRQYAAVGAAATVGLADTVAVLEAATSNGVDVGGLLERFRGRQADGRLFVEAYRRYCWPVGSIDDLRLAPFHLLASAGAVHADRNHLWHMETLAELCAADDLLHPTAYTVVDTTDRQSEEAGSRWWNELTARGGEGMVVKPLDYVSRGRRGPVQPALKSRGPEYLRIIYGPEYTEPANLERLRERGLGRKRSLALREFALGIEALERFTRGEPLRRVHECVFGVLALESEPVDPRL